MQIEICWLVMGSMLPGEEIMILCRTPEKVREVILEFKAGNNLRLEDPKLFDFIIENLDNMRFDHKSTVHAFSGPAELDPDHVIFRIHRLALEG